MLQYPVIYWLAEGLSYSVPVHSGHCVQVCGFRDPSVHNQHLVIDHRGQRQPAEDLLEKL